MIILHLPIPQFVWAQETMEKLRKARFLSSNSELVLRLLQEVTGEKAPPASA